MQPDLKANERALVRHQLLSASAVIRQLAYRQDLATDPVLELAQRLIFDIDARKTERPFRGLGELLIRCLDDIQVTPEGEIPRFKVPTGYVDLDRLLGGFRPADLIAVAGWKHAGKTSFVLNLAVNAAAKGGASIAIFSPQLSAEALSSRAFRMEAGLDQAREASDQLSENELRRVSYALNLFNSVSIWIDDTECIAIADLCANARSLASEETLDLIIVEDVDHIRIDDRSWLRSEGTDLDSVTRTLKALAGELRIPVVVVARPSGESKHPRSRAPRLTDLPEPLEQHANVVLVLHRRELSDPHSDNRGVADILVLKNHDGPQGSIPLLFQERTSKFLDLEVFRA